MTTSTVPIIDFFKFTDGTDAEKKQIATEIDNAFQNIGFVQLKNHGIPKEKVQECFDWSAKFFALPTATKLLAPHPPGGSHHRGYSALSAEKVSQDTYDASAIASLRTIPDIKESYESGNPHDANQPNIWPPESALPGFRAFLESYFDECAEVVIRLLGALSVSLGLDDGFLPPSHSDRLFQLRLLHYPALERKRLLEKRASRIGAHSDFGTLTLLFQDEVGGLHVEDPKREGEFVDVPPTGEKGDTVLVNVGDLMARWSNGRWKSTVHRVVEPPKSLDEGEMCRPRYSIPFFATADDEAVIEALPGCWGEGKPKMFEPVTARGYVQMRMAALY